MTIKKVSSVSTQSDTDSSNDIISMSTPERIRLSYSVKRRRQMLEILTALVKGLRPPKPK